VDIAKMRNGKIITGHREQGIKKWQQILI